MARLVANLPLLRGNQPPLLISMSRRAEYIDLLWTYQNAVGPLPDKGRLLSPHETVRQFKTLLKEEWRESYRLVNEAHQQAQKRNPGLAVGREGAV